MNKEKRKLCEHQMKMISDLKLYNELETQKIIIFDFRPRTAFEEASIHDFSINLPYDEVETKLLEDNNILDNKLLEQYAHSDFLKGISNKCRRLFIVIIMSDDKICKEEVYKYIRGTIKESEYCDEIVKPLKFYKNLVQSKVREIGLYTKGFNKFKSTFPFLIHAYRNPPQIL